jgi:hypothetical protein
VNAIFRLAGVDYVQWAAVTRSLLRTDFRLPLASQSSSLGRAAGWLTLALVLGLFGLGAALVIVANRDVLFTGTVTLAYLSVMLVTTLLSQHGSTLLSTADYVILGPRPVSSRTFLAIRVTNVLFHAWLITALSAYPAVVAYAISHGGGVALGALAAAAIFSWSTAVALVLVTSYSALLRAVGGARLERAVGYLQIVAGVLTYGGLMLMNRLFGRSPAANITIPDEPWLLVVPPAWYVSYLEIGTGALNSTTWIRAALSFALLGALVFALRGKLGIDYAARLAELAAAGGVPATAPTRTPLFADGAARAVAILVLAHFRHDLRVRMGVLAVVPLMLFYLFIGSHERSLELVSLAVLLFPALLSQHLASTDAYRASWIYAVSPIEQAKLVIALKNVAVAYFLGPFLLFVLGVLAWQLGDVRHAVVHTLVLGLISHIALQGSIGIAPRLPFSLPPDKTRGSAALILWLVVIILGGQGLLIVLNRWVYGSAFRTGVLIIALAAVTWLLNRLIVYRSRFIPS